MQFSTDDLAYVRDRAGTVVGRELVLATIDLSPPLATPLDREHDISRQSSHNACSAL